MTGWGRTGDWFAVRRTDGVVPDILTTAKGITGAYVPLGADGDHAARSPTTSTTTTSRTATPTRRTR